MRALVIVFLASTTDYSPLIALSHYFSSRWAADDAWADLRVAVSESDCCRFIICHEIAAGYFVLYVAFKRRALFAW